MENNSNKIVDIKVLIYNSWIGVYSNAEPVDCDEGDALEKMEVKVRT